MANGRVTTGFSKPYVAIYEASGTTVSYSDGMALARGVEVSIDPESSDDNNFYADNILAESAAGVFTGGTVTLTVDGLKDAAHRLIMGLPAAEDSWLKFGNNQVIPYVGIGFIIRTQEDQVVKYVPVVLRKCVFSTPGTSAATQEDEIDWQTQELTARIMRDDSANQDWKWLGEEQTSESAAYDMIVAALGGSNP